MGINPYQERLLIEAIERGQIPPQLLQLIKEQAKYSPEGEQESTTEAGEPGWEAPEKGSWGEKGMNVGIGIADAMMGSAGLFGKIGQSALAGDPRAQAAGVKAPSPLSMGLSVLGMGSPFSALNMALGLPMAIYNALSAESFSEGVSYDSMSAFDPADYGFNSSLTDGYNAGLGTGYGADIGDFGYGFDASGFGFDGFSDGGWDSGYGEGGFGGGGGDDGGMGASADAGAGGGMGGGADAGADGW